MPRRRLADTSNQVMAARWASMLWNFTLKSRASGSIFPGNRLGGLGSSLWTQLLNAVDDSSSRLILGLVSEFEELYSLIENQENVSSHPARASPHRLRG